MSIKAIITAKGSSLTKTFTVNKPVANGNLPTGDTTQFISSYNNVYGTDLQLSKIVKVETSETTVYPAA